MRAIVLAAGKGSRISEQIEAMPKSLLKINGRPLIEMLVEKLKTRGIHVSVCVGYCYHMLEEALSGKQVSFYYNPFYGLMNNIGTIWFAREEFKKKEDVLILSADLIFDEKILNLLEGAPGELTMVTDSRRVSDGDYFFHLNEDGEIVEFGPDVSKEKRDCEYMGISMVKKEACAAFLQHLDSMMEQGEFQQYFETVFLSFRNDPIIKLRTVDAAGLPWQEIDYFEDYQKAIEQFR